MTNYVLLLTSCLNPGNFEFVGRKDFLSRMNDYEKAVKFYLSKGLRVVFVDNSNSYLIDLKILNHPNFEFHAFLSQVSEKGKGHGGLEIIDFALKNSHFLNELDIFYKISGRYIIENIEEILHQTFDCESFHYCNISRNLYWADTRFMILTKNFYNNFFKPTCVKYLDETNGLIFEKVYARSIHFWLYQGNRIKLLPVYPFYNSFNGVTNERIFFNFYKKLKYRIYYKIKLWVFKQFV